ncbi:N,N'-diacetylchitobiose transport system substrate-binding protein [Crossiella equi]|uniref:N,N'-diacetylchitobiose transport system substrate-binding protein n=1 Tax=Crossiella equi TaxID=130796 RepID=A0ABS5AEP2_9PSEU|nr:extracellular solute-binding protein [Crossiella equi]MBP2475061.1 N,N'-diacetylchitobiose transport system substrate-binding protein [Crossiella equi]
MAGCAPVQSGPTGSATDAKDGTLRVWLFDEVNRAPKQAVVDEAIKEFTASRPNVKVDVQYIQVNTRAERFKAAFSDAKSAPDVAEFGNTDLANYVAAGGFADLSADVSAWSEGKDLAPKIAETGKVDGKLYGVPWFVGVRALYYRTDVFTELGLQPPKTLAELAPLARQIRKAKPDLYGISVGGKYTYGMLPFVWSAGGDLAKGDGGKFSSAIDSPQARAGLARYTELINDDICPASACAPNGGDASVQAFASGKAAMTIGGDFNRKAVEAGAAKGKFAVVPLPGETAGSVAPAFAGGNLLGISRSTERRTLAKEFLQLLAGKNYQRKMYTAMGNLPTFSDVQREVSGNDEFTKPFIATLEAGTKFVPVTPAWAKIDAQTVVPNMIQQVVTKQKSVDEASAEAAKLMNTAFTS